MQRLLRDEAARIAERAAQEGPEILGNDALWTEHQQNIYNEMHPVIEALAVFGVQKVRETLSPSESVGINWDLANQQAADWARAHAEERSQLISQTTRDRIARAQGKLEDVYGEVATWIEQPEAMPDLIARINVIVGDPARAEAIAVTEATATFADANTSAWAAAGYERAVVKPPAHVNCILPGNRVSLPGGLRAAAKSFYVGQAIEIRIANGRNLTVTKNHPILTPVGWVLAHELREGDYVFGTRSTERIASGVSPDNEKSEPLIEDVFRAFVESGQVFTMSVPSAPENFYGDGRFIDGDIDIVYANSLLLGDGESEIPEPVSELALVRGNMCAGPFNSQSVGTFLSPGVGFAPTSIVGSFNLSNPLVGRHLRPFEPFGFGTPTGLDASSEKATAESPPIDASLAREFVLRFASDIAAEKIVKIRNFDFSGHVYDLQVDVYELYTASSIVVKNCRCWPQPYKLPDGGKVIVWYTARDELVCKTTKIPVPWQVQPMLGCRSMHTRVISGGEYSGMKLSEAIREARANV